MQNKKNNNLILAILLLFVGTYGTFSYFTDNTVMGDVVLRTGTVSLSDDNNNSNEWKYVPLNDHANTLMTNGSSQITVKAGETVTGNSFANLRPGDYFEKEYTVTYDGSLTADITFDYTTLSNVSGFDITATINGKAAKSHETFEKVQPGAKYDLKLRVGVPVQSNNNESFGSGRNVEGGTITSLTDAFKITAIQSNITEQVNETVVKGEVKP